MRRRRRMRRRRKRVEYLQLLLLKEIILQTKMTDSKLLLLEIDTVRRLEVITV